VGEAEAEAVLRSLSLASSKVRSGFVVKLSTTFSNEEERAARRKSLFASSWDRKRTKSFLYDDLLELAEEARW
jgi:hypothetical protein